VILYYYFISLFLLTVRNCQHRIVIIIHIILINHHYLHYRHYHYHNHLYPYTKSYISNLTHNIIIKYIFILTIEKYYIKYDKKITSKFELY